MQIFRRPTILLNRAKDKLGKGIKNVVIFGETGVGKSSLINLIADENIADISTSAVGCTLDYKRHLLTIGDQRYAMWDTAGLDEESQEIFPAEKAEAHLTRLLHDLAESNGIDLLVYCVTVRGARVRSALLTNYHLFYSAICRRKVPIAIVVTGLENQEGTMDTWWLKNEKRFSALQMHFDSHACVTTLQPSTGIWNASLREKRRISRVALIKMITSTCRTEKWKPTERSWANTASSDIRVMLSARQGHGVHVANVIMCDISRNRPAGPGVIKRSVTFHSPVTLSLSRSRSVSFRSPVSVMNEKAQTMLPFDDAIKRTSERLFRVFQVPRKQTSSRGKEENMKKDMVVKRGADLLIFCAKKEGGDCKDVKSQWEIFNLTYGGDLSPQIVVIIGAMDQRSAEEWWKSAVGGAIARGNASITYWPGSKSIALAETEMARRRIRTLINTCCIDCSEVNFAEDKPILKRSASHRSDRTRTSSIRRRKSAVASNEKINTVPVPAPHKDILTKWGVWEHVSAFQGSDMVTGSNGIPHTFISGVDQEQDRLPFRPSLSR